jgi:hypothetical protein
MIVRHVTTEKTPQVHSLSQFDFDSDGRYLAAVPLISAEAGPYNARFCIPPMISHRRTSWIGG